MADSATGPQPQLLLQLPTDLLHNVWKRLHDHYNRYHQNHNQHALRSTCRALAASTVPFVSSLCVHLDSTGQGWFSFLRKIHASLHTFPSSCQLSSLTLTFHLLAEEEREFGALLPSLLMQPARLSGLRRFSIEGNRGRDTRSGLALTFGDLASIAMACPHLQYLSLFSCLCIGPLFAALRGLRDLRDLRASGLDIPRGERGAGWDRSVGTFASLSTLTQLTSLSLSSASRRLEPGLSLEDVLPHVVRLSSLKSLSLLFHVGQHGNMAETFSCLARLPQLEGLTFSPQHPPLALPGEALSSLIHSIRLTRLSLHQVALDDSFLQLLARGAPSLAHVAADSLRPKTDCSTLPCSLTTLKLRGCPSPQHLLSLPRQLIKALRFDFWNFRIGGGQAALLAEAAVLLGAHWDSSEWDVFPASVGIRRKGTAVLHCDDLLDALSPLRGKELHLLRLEGWEVGAETVRRLCAALPRQACLGLVRCAVDTGALGALARVSSLTELRLLSEVTLNDVLALVVGRCRVQGPELDLVLGFGLGLAQEQLDALSACIAGLMERDGGRMLSVNLKRWFRVGGAFEADEPYEEEGQEDEGVEGW